VFDSIQDNTSEYDANKIIAHLIEALPDAKANHSMDTEQILSELTQTKQKFAELDALKQYIMEKARLRAKLTMSLGLVGIASYFSFVAVGTYYIWSWDIVEPLAYFIGLGGSIFLASRYFKLQEDYENSNYMEYLAKKYFKKMAPRYGLDIMEYEATKMQLNELKNKLKISMLIDL
jgi:hypothetical protein